MHGVNVNTAWTFRQAGFSIFPVNPKTKSPIISGSWNTYRDRLPTWQEIGDWYLPERPAGIAVVCGKGSGNLEGIDFDNKGNPDATTLLSAWRDRVEQRTPGLYARLTIERTRSGGFHVLYRCDVIEGNQKLAQRASTEQELQQAPARWQTLIETRGEGGYLVTAPTVDYQVVQGRFSTIPTITTDERTILLDEARALNQRVIEERPAFVEREVIGNRPGDDFNGRGDIEPYLVKHGWTVVRRHGDASYWRRPGKRDGISATLNHVPGIFYNFSSSADPFDSDRGYTPFAAYTLLEHDGNFGAAAKQLRAEGFGGRDDFDQRAWLTRFKGRPLAGNDLQLFAWMQDNNVGGVVTALNNDMAAALDRSERTISRWLEALEQRGLVRRRIEKTGRYIDLMGDDKNILPDQVTSLEHVNTGGCGGNDFVSTQIFAPCGQRGDGEMRPDDTGVISSTVCHQSIPAAAIVTEALNVYGHVPTRTKAGTPDRLSLIEHYVTENGRPDLTFSRITMLYTSIWQERQRMKDDARLTEKLHGLSRKQLQRKEQSAGSKADELAREGKRGQAMVWSRMAWLASIELERRETLDLDQRAAEMRKALGRAGMVKQAMFEGLR